MIGARLAMVALLVVAAGCSSKIGDGQFLVCTIDGRALSVSPIGNDYLARVVPLVGGDSACARMSQDVRNAR